MATIVQNSKDLPERKGDPIPGSLPPIRDLDFFDDGDPEDVDAFLRLVREMRGKAPHIDK